MVSVVGRLELWFGSGEQLFFHVALTSGTGLETVSPTGRAGTGGPNWCSIAAW